MSGWLSSVVADEDERHEQVVPDEDELEDHQRRNRRGILRRRVLYRYFRPARSSTATTMATTNGSRVAPGGCTCRVARPVEKSLSRVHEEIDIVVTPDGKPVAIAHANNGSFGQRQAPTDWNTLIGRLHTGPNLARADRICGTTRNRSARARLPGAEQAVPSVTTERLRRAYEDDARQYDRHSKPLVWTKPFAENYKSEGHAHDRAKRAGYPGQPRGRGGQPDGPHREPEHV